MNTIVYIFCTSRRCIITKETNSTVCTHVKLKKQQQQHNNLQTHSQFQPFLDFPQPNLLHNLDIPKSHLPHCLPPYQDLTIENKHTAPPQSQQKYNFPRFLYDYDVLYVARVSVQSHCLSCVGNICCFLVGNENVFIQMYMDVTQLV